MRFRGSVNAFIVYVQNDARQERSDPNLHGLKHNFLEDGYMTNVALGCPDLACYSEKKRQELNN